MIFSPDERVIWLDGQDDLTVPFSIRLEVFCKEQGYTQDQELDEIDYEAKHVLFYKGDQAIATGRIFFDSPDTMHLGRLAVLKPFRGTGIGSKLVTILTEQAKYMGAKKVVLDAQCHAVSFYEKSGYVKRGEEHLDGHVLHQMMEKLL